jgi:hypothetical protein
MKRICTSIGISLLFTLSAMAQEAVAVKDTSYWKKASQFGLNLSQGTFSESWTGGGVSNIAFGLFLNSKGEYNKAKDNWVNDFQLQLGTLTTKGDGMRKSIDRIFFDSKYGRKLNAKGTWLFFANLNFLSQLANGFDFKDTRQPLTSGFFTPAYLTESIGIEWKPNKHFNMQFAPAALRHTILGNKNLYKEIDRLAAPAYTFNNFGVERTKGFLTDVGIIQLIMNYDKPVAKDVNFKWRYQAFASVNQKRFDKDKKEIRENALDQRLDAQLTAKFAKYFNVNLGLIAIIDKDQAKEMQLAQSINFGFLYAW